MLPSCPTYLPTYLKKTSSTIQTLNRAVSQFLCLDLYAHSYLEIVVVEREQVSLFRLWKYMGDDVRGRCICSAAVVNKIWVATPTGTKTKHTCPQLSPAKNLLQNTALDGAEVKRLSST